MTFDELLNLVSSNNTPFLCIDSRLVRVGDIFVAVEGSVYDGHDFIDDAVARDAKYIVCQKRPPLPTAYRSGHGARGTRHEFIIVQDSTKAAAILAQAARGNPASQLTNLAVTGTNGKTTVAFLVRSVIKNAGEKCGLIGTVIYDTGSEVCQATLTTPDCLTIAQQQQKMVQTGTKYMVIEASSHALSQNRLAAINFKAAAFTNLTGDHLDYHKTQKDYLAAKAKLFQGLPTDSTAVLNKQSPHSMYLTEKTKAKILWYAIDIQSDLKARIESMDITGTVFVLEYAGQKHKLKTSLPGRHNVSNILAAAGLCLAAGFDLQTITAGITALKTIPGRLEPVDCGQNFSVLIDYAHTDDALKNVLSTLKPLCNGKLVVVFGCGGDRDKTKRPRMARLAEQLADFIVVTSDNPRTEKPEAIIEEIVAGFENGQRATGDQARGTRHESRATKIIEPDRKKAIQTALKAAGENDIVLVAGKGHETKQIIGTRQFDFSDKEVTEECLKKLK